MNVNEAIGRILEALNEFEGVRKGRWTRRQWTRKTLTALCTVGQELGYSVYAANVEGAAGGEWLYDACWLEGEKWLTSVAMVAESEWGDVSRIEDAFQKLLVARAWLRVMVCDGWWQPGCDDTEGRATAERLKSWVGEFRDGSKGDTYLLIIYEWRKNRRYARRYRLTVSAAGKPPRLERLQPG